MNFGFREIITGIENNTPPMFVFTRAHYKDYCVPKAPGGGLGLANRSRWMNNKIYLEILKYIRKHMNCTKEKPYFITL